ncbi:Eukaryotic/viral aspartic protease [Phytophthora megakarya]|uniref:Eukaryotic/viral aspartic protease n=1 Tax=Phytophthora megakarya TaxID=4795 RepID=A0A225VF23_9STRA|nr:Eukaryotic/viral aspartic protease [Phytophthora megakarya]
MGAIDDTRTRILLDTGANVSVISAAYAKGLRLREVSDHGRSLEVRGINPRVLETRRRTLVKITLGWERVYEFEMWIMEHSAGVDVVLGTDFMILADVRLDLFHGTARLPDEVTVPLVKSAGAADDEPYG